MNKNKKIIIYMCVILVSVVIYLGSVPIVSAVSYNRAIDPEPGARESKHPPVDSLRDSSSDNVYTSFTAWDSQTNPPNWGIFLSMSPSCGRTWNQIGWVDGRAYPWAAKEQDFSDVFIQKATGRIHIVWQEKNFWGKWVIHYRYYDSCTSTWGGKTILSTNFMSQTVDAMYPKIAADGVDD